jgi:Ca-activated chloride channel family protein
MIRMLRARASLLLLLPLCLAGQESESFIRVDVNVVNVVCTVRSRTGGYVNDLTSADFRIVEDGKPQQIRYFSRRVRTPAAVALLVDTSGSVEKDLQQERLAAGHFLREVLRPGDQGLLASFSHLVQVWQPLTSRPAELHAGIAALRPLPMNLDPALDPHGGTLLYEAVQKVSDDSLARAAGRKLIVVVSDGLDNGSRVSAAEAIAAAQRADAVVYAIHYGSDRPQLEQGQEALFRLAEPTGGRAYHVSPLLTLDSIFG